MKMNRVVLLITLSLLTVPGTMRAAGPNQTKQVDSVQSTSINRYDLVTRNNIEVDVIDKDSLLQVGNGQFAFNVDATGLQTFYGMTLCDSAWHEWPLPAGMKPDDRQRTEFVTHGRKRYYLAPHDQKELARWLFDNPHRANLFRLRFASGEGIEKVSPEDICDIHQKSNLWTGLIESNFEFNGKPVRVKTVCHPDQNIVAVSVDSSLLANGELHIVLDFPYPASKGRMFVSPEKDWSNPDLHKTDHMLIDDCRVDIQRKVDNMSYKIAWCWSKGGVLKEIGPHAYQLSSNNPESLEFIVAYSPKDLPADLPSLAQVESESAAMWKAYWQSGGAIDLSGSRDERWKELERRIVVSRYLMRVNSAGSIPPAEIGLLGVDVWLSKCHLEMTAWHGTHFMLWSHPECVSGWVRWFQEIGLPSARREAAAEGWKGAKWLKTPDPYGRWESWDHGPNRVTQNVHPFYWAELSYRENPSAETLETWKDIIFETATMMADFMYWDEPTKRYIMGPPVMSGAEGGTGFDSWNSTSELSYWALSLEIAQKWLERLGLAREPKWDDILSKLSRPPVTDGVYIDAESSPSIWNRSPSGKFLRPAWLEVYGCIQGPMIDREIMGRTYDRVARQLRSGEWKGNLWGCDFPMLAMTVARLGRPEEAVDWLLYKTPKNEYFKNGSCEGWYLPGNGGLLWAVAMMAAGWDGGPDRHAPGFPNDGKWQVNWEGLRPAP